MKCNFWLKVQNLTADKKNSKKTEEFVKAEMLRSLKETNEECDAPLDEMGNQMTRHDDPASIIKQYEEIILTQEKKIVGLLIKQGYILKKFNDKEHFFETVGLSKSTIYFKINIYKFVKKYPVYIFHNLIFIHFSNFYST